MKHCCERTSGSWAGRQVWCAHRLHACRGTAKIWRPKVTPLCDLKSGPAQQLPVGPDGEIYVQKTSLAADPSKAAVSDGEA